MRYWDEARKILYCETAWATFHYRDAEDCRKGADLSLSLPIFEVGDRVGVSWMLVSKTPDGKWDVRPMPEYIFGTVIECWENGGPPADLGFPDYPGMMSYDIRLDDGGTYFHRMRWDEEGVVPEELAQRWNAAGRHKG